MEDSASWTWKHVRVRYWCVTSLRQACTGLLPADANQNNSPDEAAQAKLGYFMKVAVLISFVVSLNCSCVIQASQARSPPRHSPLIRCMIGTADRTRFLTSQQSPSLTLAWMVTMVSRE
jgi:hypothetical protein